MYLLIMRISDYQHNRELFSQYIPIILKNFGTGKVLVGNFGCIFVPSDPQRMVKKLFLVEFAYNKEVYAYNLYSQNGILVPRFTPLGKLDISGNIFYILELENIRAFSQKFDYFVSIDASKLGNIYSKIHALSAPEEKIFLHSNPHESNFFLNSKNELWIFDLWCWLYWDREYDFALIYIYSSYNEDYLDEVLNNYIFVSKFNRRRMYNISMQIIIDKIRTNKPIREEGIGWLKIALSKIKDKVSA